MTVPPRIPSRCSECGARVELRLGPGNAARWVDAGTEQPHRFVRPGIRARDSDPRFEAIA